MLLMKRGELTGCTLSKLHQYFVWKSASRENGDVRNAFWSKCVWSRWILTNGAFGRMHSVSLPLFVGNTVYVCGYVNSAVNTSTRLCRAEWLIKPSDHPICITHTHVYFISSGWRVRCEQPHASYPSTRFSQTPCTHALRLICILTHWGRISLKRGSGAFTLLTNQASNATFGSCCGADETKIVSWVCVCWWCLSWVRGWMRFVWGRRG
jgi:hypothetical protein